MSENFSTPKTKSQTLNNKNENSKLENAVSQPQGHDRK